MIVALVLASKRPRESLYSSGVCRILLSGSARPKGPCSWGPKGRKRLGFWDGFAYI